MPIPVVCSKCQAQLAAPDAAAGKAVRCKCGAAVPVPAVANASRGAVTKGAPVAAPQVASYLDQLTENDVKQSQVNPYAPPPKVSNTDAAVLRKYVKDNNMEAKAKAASSNILLLTIFNFIGFGMNTLAGVGMLAIAANAEQLKASLPLVAALGLVGAVLMFCFAAYDLATAIGLITKGAWGWWLALIGLGWGMSNSVFNAASTFLISEEIARAIGGAVGCLIFLLIAGSLIQFLLSKDTQKKFKVNVSVGLGWGAALGIGLVLGGVLFGIGFATGIYSGVGVVAPPAAAPTGAPG
jgi:hypothetical protein